MMFPFISSVILLLLLSIFVITVVHTLPTGAPVCTVGDAAPESLHRDPSRNPRTGPLSDGSFFIQIDNETVLPTDGVINLPAQMDIPITVTSESGLQPFRGVLLVLSKVGVEFTDELFVSSDDPTEPKLKVSVPCQDTDRTGVTHTSRELKTSVTAFMNVGQNLDNVILSVNVVVVNNNETSIYYFDDYLLSFSGGTEAPTPAPEPEPCGLFGLGLYCPRIRCGFFGRLFFGPNEFCP